MTKNLEQVAEQVRSKVPLYKFLNYVWQTRAIIIITLHQASLYILYFTWRYLPFILSSDLEELRHNQPLFIICITYLNGKSVNGT